MRLTSSKLPHETRADLEAQATIGAADIEKAKQMVRDMKGAVKYVDGKVVKVVRAEKLRGMWEEETPAP